MTNVTHVTKVDTERAKDGTIVANVSCSCGWTRIAAGRDEHFVRRAASGMAFAHRQGARS